MKAWKILKTVWHCWCGLWQLDWEHCMGVDQHKWESKVEMRQRMARQVK
jgi:hypothetical protein